MSGRSLVQEQVTSADTKHVAGIVVVRQQPDGTFRVLALLPGKEIASDDGEASYQFYGNYDIPKGHAKEGEPPLTAALRETGEETGYSASDLDFRWGQQTVQVPGKRNKVGTFFVAVVDSDPVLRRNPENGMLEHGGFKWVTFGQMVERVGNFWFAAAIPWARGVVESEDTEVTNEGLLRNCIRELFLELAEARYKGFRREVKDRVFPHLPEFVFKDLYDREGLKDYVEDRAEDIQRLGMEEFFTTDEYAKESYDRYNLNWSQRPVVLDLSWDDIGTQERAFLMKKHAGADPNFPQEEYKTKLDRVLSTTPLRRNPENGMLEHGGFKWVTFDQMVERVGNFWFAAVIPWARGIVESEDVEVTNEGLLRQYIYEAIQTEPEKPQVVPESQIYCDMDGVLVDFETSVISMLNEYLGGKFPVKVKISEQYKIRLQALQSELGEDWRAETGAHLDIPVVRSFMFEAIALAPASAYSKMLALPDGVEQLWPFLNSTGHVVNLLSAPINNRWKNTPTAGDGKRQWAEILSPPPADIIIISAKQKKEYATAGGVPNILIDDRASTVDAWNKAGGVAILHRPGDSAGTIRQLQELGL